MSEVPVVPRSTGLKTAVAAIFSANGALARSVDGYEHRPGQKAMAAAVAATLEDGGTLLAEAGTGTGKTLAYLVPAILSRQRVLISTGTKNLQDQLFLKDLPALSRALDVPFTATVMKGRSNYLCRHRFARYREGVSGEAATTGRLIESGDRLFLPILEQWSGRTETGDRAELRDLPEDLPLWSDVAASAETCLGVECPSYSDCFVTKMRQRAAESDIVIVNHHLLCADAAVRQSAFGEVIPACSTLVVDEAHQLEDIATQYFGIAVSNYRVEDLARDCASWLESRGVGETPDRLASELERAIAKVRDRARAFFSAVLLMSPVAPGTERRARYSAETLSEHLEDGMMLAGALEGLEGILGAVQTPAESPDPGAGPADSHGEASAHGGTIGGDAEPTGDDVGDASSLARRAGDLRTQLRLLLRASDPDFVYYVEIRGPGVFLRASPVDVSRIVHEAIFDRARAAVLTSATLAVEGSFAYIRERLGVRSCTELRVPSDFDYAHQAILYLPRRMPPPRSPSFAEAAAREVADIVSRTRGRAFVLFTSVAVLRAVRDLLDRLVPFPLLVQGSAPRSALIEQFRTTPEAVLLATASFWQGVDVVGEALSCVVIDKLPFASPSDPIVSARIEAIQASGGDAFGEYQVPLAILTLQQGLGRLIRHRSDRGVLAILDPRLQTMGYGRRFLDSLPPAPITRDPAEIERFLGLSGAPAGIM